MPRASRHFLPGYIWHITHRCHQREFLLKHSRDRQRWIHWLFEAKKRFGLCVLNYTVTSNHVHLLVKDTGDRVISNSMQLIAGRVAQEFNQRKGRKGAFWEDRYHATAVAADDHLARCVAYIDLNMVRAGAVEHPSAWSECGYAEMLSGRRRYTVTDCESLKGLMSIDSLEALKAARESWLQTELAAGAGREDRWTQGLAVGELRFVEEVKSGLGGRARWRTTEEDRGGFVLREDEEAYGPVWA